MIGSRNPICIAIIIYIVALFGNSGGQSSQGDERIWCEIVIESQLDRDPAFSDYSGGRVSFRASGRLEQVEYDDSSLVGYAVDDLPFTLTAEPCKRIDQVDGSTASRIACRVTPLGRISVNCLFNLNTGRGQIELNSWDLAICTEAKCESECDQKVELGLYLGSVEYDDVPNTIPPISLTRADLEEDFDKTFTWDIQDDALFGCPNVGQGRITLRAKPPDETKITLDGCADILVGTDATVTANAKPEGGSYRWKSEPSSLFNISGSDKSVTITGGSAGRGSISVEYTPKRGKKEKAELSGSVVELLSVNGGTAIPPIGLYDENGAAKAALQVPIVMDPPEGDLLTFMVADDAIASAQNLGTSLVIQGVKEGKTSIQAQTKCGQKDEQIIPIEVVPCDQETIKKLKDQLKDLQAQLDENKKKFDEKLKDPEFQTTMNEINRKLTAMGVKTLSVATAIGGGVAGEAPGALDYVLEVLSQIQEVTEEGTWTGKWNIQDMVIKYYTTMGKKMTLGILTDIIEYGEAYSEAREKIEVLERIVKELEDINKEGKEIRKKYNEIDLRLIDICKDYGMEPPPSEPPPTEPPPSEPPPSEPPPSEPPQPPPSEPPSPPPSEPGSGEKPPAEPPGDDDVIIEPPAPPSPPPGAPGGFQVECGCDGWDQNNWGGNMEGLGRISQDVMSMVPCLDDFNQNTIGTLQSTADTTNILFERMEQALSLPEGQKVKAFRGFLTEIDGLENQYNGFYGEFMSVTDSLGQCNKEIDKAGEIIRGGGSH